jgi:two-component system NarL family sensor kinase
MLTKEQEIYLAILIAVSFLTLILIFFIINLMVNQRKIRKLQKSLISAEIITLETERKRFSQDLHDDIGPNLSAVLLYTNIIEPVDPENQEIKEKMEEILTSTLQMVRSISQNVTPRYIQEHGLTESLKKMIGNFNMGLNGKTSIVLNVESTPPGFSELENLNIYRIIQESINNAVKHAEAVEIRVTISTSGNKTSIIISDNGKGFDYSLVKVNDPKSKAGIGLKNIQNRVIFLGGQLNIYSQKGKGTQIVAEIPIM